MRTDADHACARSFQRGLTEKEENRSADDSGRLTIPASPSVQGGTTLPLIFAEEGCACGSAYAKNCGAGLRRRIWHVYGDDHWGEPWHRAGVRMAICGYRLVCTPPPVRPHNRARSEALRGRGSFTRSASATTRRS